MHGKKCEHGLKSRGQDLYARFAPLSLGLVGLLSFTSAYAADVANVPDSMRSRLSTSSVGLTEQFGVSGRLVRLQGRFQSLSVVETDSSGKAKVKCLTPGPDSIKELEAIDAHHSGVTKTEHSSAATE